MSKWEAWAVGDERGRAFVWLDGWKVYDRDTGWAHADGALEAHPGRALATPDGSLVVAPGSVPGAECEDATRGGIWQP